MKVLQKVFDMPYSWLDKQGPEEKLSFNTLVSKHLRDITLACGVLQIFYAIMSFINRFTDSGFSTFDSTSYFVDSRANSGFWSGVFFLSGIITVWSLKRHDIRTTAMAVSSACFLIWGITVSVRSLTEAYRPILFLLGITAICVAVVAYKVCLAWHVVMFNHKFYLKTEIDEGSPPFGVEPLAHEDQDDG